MSTAIKTVLIYGYGVMGRGVAKTFADAGFATLVKSSRAGQLEGLPATTSVVEQLPKEAPVLEVMAGLATSRAEVDRVADALRRTGKEPVVLYKPIVGFLVNRLQHAILHEAYYLIEAGVASAEDIDHAVRRMLAPRMCLNGLIQQKDISGLKIHADAQESIVPKLFHNATPNPMLQTMVALGRTRLSAGQGFYDWNGWDGEAVRSQASGQPAKPP